MQKHLKIILKFKIRFPRRVEQKKISGYKLCILH